MRVIAGTLGGRRLLGPPRGTETRPTSDRVREALFNIVGTRVAGARVLDLFAGTGALGIEALSRGAARVTFVESDRGLCETIRTNLESVEATDRATIVCRDARRALRKLAGPFDLILVDPPYGHLLEREALSEVARGGLLEPGGVLVVEHSSREPVRLAPEAGRWFSDADVRNYGDTSLSCYTARATPDVPGTPETAAAPRKESGTMARVAVYAGSFDPPTNGHVDIIRRAAKLFDRLVVAVAPNVRKNALLDPNERVEILREVIGDDPQIEVDLIEGLLVHYAQRKGAVALIRGLRAVADFDYEFTMACMNHHLAPGVETMFLMTAQEHFYVSSSLVKEVAALGGEIDAFVPPAVLARLRGKMAARKP